MKLKQMKCQYKISKLSCFRQTSLNAHRSRRRKYGRKLRTNRKCVKRYPQNLDPKYPSSKSSGKCLQKGLRFCPQNDKFYPWNNHSNNKSSNLKDP